MDSIICKIDITPLVGVALILVIVFMVTSPMMMTTADMQIDLPKAKTIETKSETNITVSLSNEKELALNDKIVSFTILSNELKKLVKEYPDRLVIISADKNVQHKKILQLLSLVKKTGANHLAFATLQRNRNGD